MTETKKDDRDPADVAVGRRIREAVGEGSADEIAPTIEVSAATLRRWMRGAGAADAQALARIAQLTGYALEWLVTGRGPKRISEAGSRQGADQVELLVYDGRLTAGGAGGFVFEGDPVDALVLPTSFLRAVGQPEKMHIVPVQGDSMAPEINHGDWAIIDVSQRRATENVFAFNLDDFAVVKRLRLLGGGNAQLVSVNPTYEPIDIRLDSDNLIVGRVVYTIRRVG